MCGRNRFLPAETQPWSERFHEQRSATTAAVLGEWVTAQWQRWLMIVQITDKRIPNYFSFIDSEEYATGLQ